MSTTAQLMISRRRCILLDWHTSAGRHIICRWQVMAACRAGSKLRLVRRQSTCRRLVSPSPPHRRTSLSSAARVVRDATPRKDGRQTTGGRRATGSRLVLGRVCVRLDANETCFSCCCCVMTSSHVTIEKVTHRAQQILLSISCFFSQLL